MPYKISDIVKSSSTSEFRNDVQLSEYRSKHNLSLVEGYIFTRKAVAQKKSSINLLKYICESFTAGRNPNRFVFMATYGHGKSHFALSLANYFGKKSDSPEIKAVLSNIEHAVNDAALYGYFNDFKSQRKPHLVLILSGIDQRDLSTQFYNAVEVALAHDSLSESISLPFWYKGAAKFVETINASGSKERANTLLEKHGIDTDILLDRINNQDSTIYDICYNLCIELNGIAPNFGSAVNLKEAVSWLSENLCGVDKPYSGVLILFDEFSAFVRDYGLSMNSRPGTPLQDLLDGVDVCKEKVTFVAFSQHDPEVVARNVLHTSGTASLQNLLIQLNRLPTPQRYHLHSCLEEVLDSYIRQDVDKWAQICADSRFANELYDANDMAMEVFKSRYEVELGWSSEHFQEVVTKGCYPLHPMTTALLSSVEFQETTNPRSVLGFVLKSLDVIKDVSVVQNDRPTWVLPIALVDYFKEMLGAEIWKDYIDAKSQAGGADASESEVSALKSMVLQKAANIATRQFGYDKVLSQFAGVPKTEATNALQGLAGRGVIRHDTTQKLYMFWPAGRGANKVEELLVNKVSKISSFSRDLMSKVEVILRNSSLLAFKPLSVSWGHREDWQADEIIASREMITSESIKKLIADRLCHHLNGDDNKVRGLIVWLISVEDADVFWFRDNLNVLLSQEFPNDTIPIVFRRPRTHNPEIASLFKRAYGLTNFSNAERQEVGIEQYDAVFTQLQINLKDAIDIMRSNSETETLPAFRARLKAVSPRNVEQLFDEIYKMAYPRNPSKWFHQYKLSQTTLKSATKLLVGHLLNNTLDVPQALNANKVAKEAVDLFIRPEWRIVDSSNRIKVPSEGAKVYDAWVVLDNYFSVEAGARSVKKVIEQLLNVPYGFDINTASIVFAAWCGFNRHELEMSESGKIITITNIKTDSKDFIKHLSEMTIKRRNPNELKGKVNDILRVLQSGKYDIEGAAKALKILEEYITMPNAEDKQTAIDAKSSLSIALEKAVNYDKVVDGIYSTLSRSGTFNELFSALNTLKQLSFSSKVTPINNGISDVRKDILSRIETSVVSTISSLQTITSLSDYSLRQKNLNDLKTRLNGHDLTHLVKKVDDAISNLNKCKSQLENQDKDKEAVAYISGLATTGTLSVLRQSLEKLLNMELYSDGAKNKANDKSKSISKEIERLSSLLLSICNRFEKAISDKDIKSVLADLHRIQPLLDKSEEASISTALIGRCTKLDEFFDSFADIQRKSIFSPEQANEVITALNELQNKYKLFFSPEMNNIIPKAISNHESVVQSKRNDAIKWLDKLEQDLVTHHKPDVVLDSLKKVPAFLPKELHERVKELNKNAQQMMDENQVLHVVTIFNKIADHKKRLECLSQLQSLVNGGN